jgi:hypothetical protein
MRGFICKDAAAHVQHMDLSRRRVITPNESLDSTRYVTAADFEDELPRGGRSRTRVICPPVEVRRLTGDQPERNHSTVCFTASRWGVGSSWPNARSNLDESMTRGRRNWYAVSRNSRSMGEKMPATARNVGPAIWAFAGVRLPAASKARSKNSCAVSGSAAGRCQTSPSAFGPG